MLFVLDFNVIWIDFVLIAGIKITNYFQSAWAVMVYFRFSCVNILLQIQKVFVRILSTNSRTWKYNLNYCVLYTVRVTTKGCKIK